MGKFIDLVLKYEWVVLVILLYPMLFPRPETTPVMLVVPLLWYLHWRRGNGFLPRTPLNLPLLILVVMLAVSLAERPRGRFRWRIRRQDAPR